MIHHRIVGELEFTSSLLGRVISEAEITPEGIHIVFDDGRVLILSGQFVAWIGEMQKGMLQ